MAASHWSDSRIYKDVWRENACLVRTARIARDRFERERQLKKWNRAWKLELIERTNPGWRDLAEELTP
jgi:predicted GIY-YIG superfamily endonuclease